MSLLDANDNAPVFTSSSYVSSVLLKDAEVGKLLLTLEATDRDTGNNSLLTYRSVLETEVGLRGERLQAPVWSGWTKTSVSSLSFSLFKLLCWEFSICGLKQ